MSAILNIKSMYKLDLSSEHMRVKIPLPQDMIKCDI